MLTMVLRVMREKAVKEEMEKQSWPNSLLEVTLSEIQSSSICLSIDNEGDGRELPGLTVPLPVAGISV